MPDSGTWKACRLASYYNDSKLQEKEKW